MLTFLFFLSGTYSSVAQDISVSYGPESKIWGLYGFIGSDETGTYAIATKDKMFEAGYFFLEHYDNSLSPTRSLDLKFKDGKGQKREFERLFHLNNKLYAFTSEVDSDKSITTLYVETINKKTLKKNNDTRAIAQLDYQDFHNSGVRYFDFLLSEDKEKLLIIRRTPGQYEGKIASGFDVYDGNMTRLWSKDIRILDFGTESYQIDNNGNTYIRVKKSDKCVITAYYNNGNEAIEYDIMTRDKDIQSMKMIIEDGKEIICSGFYSSNGSESIKGSYLVKINGSERTVSSIDFDEFDSSLLSNKKTSKKKGKSKDDFFKLDRVVKDGKGGFVIIGEKRKSRKSLQSSEDGGGYLHRHFYNNILIVSLSASGKINWTKQIAKKQYAQGNGLRDLTLKGNGVHVNILKDDGMDHLSFSFYQSKGLLHFMYNDNKKNIDILEDPCEYRGYKNSSIAHVSVDLNGNINKKEVKDTDNFQIKTSNTQVLDDGNMVVYGYKSSKPLLANLELNP